MQPIFGTAREHNNRLYIAHYKKLDMSSFHFHSQLELILIEKGSANVLINGKNKILKSGAAAIATSYQPHGFHSDEECLATIIFIPTYLCEDFITITESKTASSPFIEDEETVKVIRDCLKRIDSGSLNRIEEIGYLHVMLGAILKSISFDGVGEPIDRSLMSEVLFYISKNYKEDINADKIAAQFGYSKAYISKLFRDGFKTSIGQYLTTVRLKNALLLLKNGDMSITDAALESGFPSIRTFYRAFNSEFGISPREYVRKN